MAGLAHDAPHYFKYIFMLVLYTFTMTLYVRPCFTSLWKLAHHSLQNFYLGVMFSNGGIAILLSALTALYQMTYAGFFVHLGDIPPVLRWLQWLCPLKYALEALSVNEVGSGLMIQDVLEGVPVNVSASLIMGVVRASLPLLCGRELTGILCSSSASAPTITGATFLYSSGSSTGWGSG